MAVECTIPDRVISIKDLIMRYVYNDEWADDLPLLAQINHELDMIKDEANVMEYKLRKIEELAENKN